MTEILHNGVLLIERERQTEKETETGEYKLNNLNIKTGRIIQRREKEEVVRKEDTQKR